MREKVKHPEHTHTHTYTQRGRYYTYSVRHIGMQKCMLDSYNERERERGAGVLPIHAHAWPRLRDWLAVRLARACRHAPKYVRWCLHTPHTLTQS